MNLRLLLLAIVLFLPYVKLKAAVANFSPEQLLMAQKNGNVIIDIRTATEWEQQGTIPGASKITFFDQNRKPLTNEFMSEFKKLVTSKDQPFILVCRSGNRTGIVAQFLDENLGYTNAAHLSKGMNQWKVEKHPIDKSNN